MHCFIGLTKMPMYIDKNGTYRFVPDRVLEHAFDVGALNLNKLAANSDIGPNGKYTLEEWLVFRAKLGYSHSGLCDVEMSYQSDFDDSEEGQEYQSIIGEPIKE